MKISQKMVLPLIAGLFVVAGVVSWVVRGQGSSAVAEAPKATPETIGH